MNKMMLLLLSLAISVVILYLSFSRNSELEVNLAQFSNQEIEAETTSDKDGIHSGSNVIVETTRQVQLDDISDADLPATIKEEVVDNNESEPDLSNDEAVEPLSYNDDWSYFKSNELYTFMFENIESYPSTVIDSIECTEASCTIKYYAYEGGQDLTEQVLRNYEESFDDDIDLKLMQSTSSGLKVSIEINKSE